MWFGDSRDDVALDWLESLPFTMAFVCGNHENYDALERYPVKDWHGANWPSTGSPATAMPHDS